MATVVWHISMSVDGFIAAPGDDMAWIFESWGSSEVADEAVRETGAIVMGRRTFEVEDRDRPGIYGGAWKGALFVVTHDPPSPVPEWMTGTFAGSFDDALAQAKAAAGDRRAGLLGASMARQALEAGELDEIVIHVLPTLLGDGVRLYDVAGGRRVRLEKLAVAESGPMTDLRFRVVR